MRAPGIERRHAFGQRLVSGIEVVGAGLVTDEADADLRLERRGPENEVQGSHLVKAVR